MISFEEFKNLAAPKTIIPLYQKINGDFLTPSMLYLKLREAGKNSFLLESVTHGEHLGRYSFIGFSPFYYLKDTGHGVYEGNPSGGCYPVNISFFDKLSNCLKDYMPVRLDDLPHFTCGAVGFIDYEMAGTYEALPLPHHDSIGTDYAFMAFYKNLIAIDHAKNEVILISNVFVENTHNLQERYQEAHADLQTMSEKIRAIEKKEASFYANIQTVSCHFKKENFLQAIQKAKSYIYAGDIFQVVLSRRFSLPYEGDPFHVYRSLRNINPSPYLYYLDCADYQIIGSSPEPLIRCLEGELEIIPIAGTRPRGQTKEEDESQAFTLLNDPKELSEHIMLVDLARNDMGRIAEYGSIRVQDLKTIERYSHVMHIISRVTGHLRKDLHAVDAFKASFPAGTVSGAPKIRAMEIIHELEPENRGIYSGAIGYFDYSGNSDTCIAIRTLIAKENRLYFQAGAGIVAESDPERECQEINDKAKAMIQAIVEAKKRTYDFIY